MRLINADELKEFVKEKCWYCTSFINEEKVLSWIDNAPTIEPNELDLDIDYSIEYDKRPDGISNAKVTITRIKPRNIIACGEVDELDMLERMYADADRPQVNSSEWVAQKEQEFEELHRPKGEDWYNYSEEMWKFAYERGQNDRPKGKWIDKDGELVCSICGNSVSFTRTSKGWVLGKFCQSCGADMRGAW